MSLKKQQIVKVREATRAVIKEALADLDAAGTTGWINNQDDRLEETAVYLAHKLRLRFRISLRPDNGDETLSRYTK